MTIPSDRHSNIILRPRYDKNTKRVMINLNICL